MSDPLYYPLLLKAGVSSADALQYVAYYQHVMAQDTLDKWRDEAARADAQRDRLDRDARKQHWRSDATPRSMTAVQQSRGGQQAWRQLRFTPL